MKGFVFQVLGKGEELEGDKTEILVSADFVSETFLPYPRFPMVALRMPGSQVCAAFPWIG